MNQGKREAARDTRHAGQPGPGAFQAILADITPNARRCPGCKQDGQAAPCVFCGQLQDPACGYGTRYDPPATETPGRWRCAECGAVTADEPPALLARKGG